MSETLDFGDRVTANLSWPYAGGLRIAGLPAGATYTVRGSTLNLSAVCERLSVSYQTRYERVALRVPTDAEPEPDGHGELARPERQDAALIAFWGDLVAACSLHPPEVDQSVSQTMVDRYCRKGKVSAGLAQKPCTQTIQHVKLCQCSGKESPDDSWDEVVDCDCGKSSSGTWLGLVRQVDGYVPCKGEDDNLADPEYYKEKCCEEPQGELPQCKKIREPFQGGEEIEGGPEYYRQLYGPNVRMEAVTPEGGSCGEIIRKWEVEAKNCCLDVLPLRADPSNPNKIDRGDKLTLKVLDGRPDVPFEWRAYGGLVMQRSSTRTLGEGTDTEVVVASHNICHQPWVIVDDGCQPVTLYFEGNNSDPAVLGARSLAVEPGVTFPVAVVKDGVAPFFWYSPDPDIELISQSEDGRNALFKIKAGTGWCEGVIYCNDVCGKTVRCDVKNALTGKWHRTSDIWSEWIMKNPEFYREMQKRFPFSPYHYNNDLCRSIVSSDIWPLKGTNNPVGMYNEFCLSNNDNPRARSALLFSSDERFAFAITYGWHEDWNLEADMIGRWDIFETDADRIRFLGPLSWDITDEYGKRDVGKFVIGVGIKGRIQPRPNTAWEDYVIPDGIAPRGWAFLWLCGDPS